MPVPRCIVSPSQIAVHTLWRRTRCLATVGLPSRPSPRGTRAISRKMGASLAETRSPPPPVRVLVIGGSYAGLSAALNLQDLCSGRPARCGPRREAEESETGPSSAPPTLPVDITIVDERDGFCTTLPCSPI
ncbi:hypothetical protein VTK73DRAFT_9121 [Phialemonium thermophilum]|uniref:Uncharacterized protein n=1 Tax=Phialemonium thermophilum TaxID=223376 RepID=A0ABR3W4M7_9PEZI